MVYVTAGHDNDRSYLYGYDRLNRLLFALYGQLDGSQDNLALLSDPAPAGRIWKLDLLGNWSGDPTGQHSVVDYSESGVRYEHHQTKANNAIDKRFVDGPDGTQFTYDMAGNLTGTGTTADDRTYIYDARNRLVEVRRASDDAPVAQYRYDALGRRVNKKVYLPANLQTHARGDFFYYDGNRLIEYHKTEAETYLDCSGGGGGPAPEKRIEQPATPPADDIYQKIKKSTV